LVLGLIWLGLLVTGVPLASLAHQLTFSGAGIFVPIAPFALVGVVLARRVPRNPIGWILLALALTAMFSTDVGFYALRAYRLGEHRLPLARVAVFFAAGWFWLILLMPLPIALFPDGRLPPRWRRTLPAYLVLCALLLAEFGWQDITGIFARHIRIDSTGELAIFGNSPNHSMKIVERVFLPLYACFFLGWVLRQVAGYRRAVGVERQQLKWLFSGGTICVVALALGITVSNTVVGSVAWTAIAALPIGIGVGILKYRLYEIDRLISRTISYAILTTLLVAVFVGIVVLATDVLPFSSPVGVAASTLAAAALFNPLRLRVQRLVDRRFNRARYDAEAIVAAFTLRLRDAVDLDTVRHELLAAVDGAVQPTHASVWLRPRTSRLGT
jgi:hypothetical protein